MYFLFLLISLLIIFGRSVGEFPEKQCCVFPGSKSKCFPPTYDLTGKKDYIKETKYYGTNKYETIQTTKVAKEGILTVAGANDSQEFYLNKNLNFLCEKDAGALYTDSRYGTKLQYSIASEDPRSFFITTRRELWICSKDKDTIDKDKDEDEDEDKGKDKNDEIIFFRVVTEHLSKHAIKIINFHDGASFVKIPIPRVKAGDPQLFTVAIREIKYVLPHTDENFMYLGSLKFRALNPNRGYYNDFEKLSMSTDDESGTTKVSINQQQRPEKTIFKQQLMNNTGQPESFMDLQKIAICNKIDMRETDPRLFGVLPMWSHAKETLVAVGGIEKRKLGPWTEITASAFLEHFVVTKYQMMKCKVKPAGETFFRANIHYLGTVNIDEAYFSDKKKGVYSFQLPYSTDKSMGIRENINFMIDDTKTFFDFRGRVKIQTVNKKSLCKLQSAISVISRSLKFCCNGFKRKEDEFEGC